ncbi:MAG: hypothetical protein CBC55_03675 [Gammaproteobacteria bacterium TMED95]|nr:MAG: hypothetical protein CBC55_03675 [Gammaproteobacteria bacterium TMED95]|tara:strand:+ start:1181 stop:1552 length:372 start_codon:yes stop_codon:yes gene_type:complete
MKNNTGPFEVTDEYYEDLDAAAHELAEAEYQLSLITDGVDIMEKTLMFKADQEYKTTTNSNKSLPIELQRREAKRSPEYAHAVRAKAAAKRAQSLAKSKRFDLDKRFDEWRTRSADKRNAGRY